MCSIQEGGRLARGKRLGVATEGEGNRPEQFVDRTFGPSWPFVAMAVEAAAFVVALVVLAAIGSAPGAPTAWAHLLGFLTSNLALIVVVMVLFALANYVGRRWRFRPKWLEPSPRCKAKWFVFDVAGILVGFWFLAQILTILAANLPSPGLRTLADNLWILSVALAILVPILKFLALLGRFPGQKASSRSDT